jgi:hypothetical protein
MTSAKISHELRAKLNSADRVRVVIELVPLAQEKTEGLGRSELITRRKEAFRRRANEVLDEVDRHGGEVLGQAWINESIHADVPAGGVVKLAELDVVATIDVPGELVQGG